MFVRNTVVRTAENVVWKLLKGLCDLLLVQIV